MTLSLFYAIQLIKLTNIAPYIYFQVIQVKFLENNEEKVLKILMPVLLHEIEKEIHMNYKSWEGYHYI